MSGEGGVMSGGGGENSGGGAEVTGINNGWCRILLLGSGFNFLSQWCISWFCCRRIQKRWRKLPSLRDNFPVHKVLVSTSKFEYIVFALSGK
ncbi:hypothetical protein P8452_71491 [Trifolium repens]|nr:hypothetical protein P8452_71491 [Trifolium repens]